MKRTRNTSPGFKKFEENAYLAMPDNFFNAISESETSDTDYDTLVAVARAVGVLREDQDHTGIADVHDHKDPADDHKDRAATPDAPKSQVPIATPHIPDWVTPEVHAKLLRLIDDLTNGEQS